MRFKTLAISVVALASLSAVASAETLGPDTHAKRLKSNRPTTESAATFKAQDAAIDVYKNYFGYFGGSCGGANAFCGLLLVDGLGNAAQRLEITNIDCALQSDADFSILGDLSDAIVWNKTANNGASWTPLAAQTTATSGVYRKSVNAKTKISLYSGQRLEAWFNFSAPLTNGFMSCSVAVTLYIKNP